MIGQKHVRDGDVWSFGSVPEVRRVGLESAIAPDFRTPTRATTTPWGCPARTMTGSRSPSGCGHLPSGDSSNCSATSVRVLPASAVLRIDH